MSNIEQIPPDRQRSVLGCQRGVASPKVRRSSPLPAGGGRWALPEKTCGAIVVPPRLGNWPLNVLL